MRSPCGRLKNWRCNECSYIDDDGRGPERPQPPDPGSCPGASTPGASRGCGGFGMNILQTLRVAVLALLRNKLRSFLTTLGIIIGVSAAIAMASIGEGAKARVEESFASMGSNLLVVLPGSTSLGGQRGGFGSMPTLTWDDLRAIRTERKST